MAKKKRSTVEGFDPTKHVLVPAHEKLTKEETERLFAQHQATMRELPKISVKDPALKHLSVRPGDVVRINRKSPTAGSITFYRGVVDE